MAILQRLPPVQFSFWSQRAGLRQSTCFEATAFILTALTAHPTTHIDLPHIGASDNAAAVVSGLSLHKLGRHQHQPPPKCESASVGVGTVNNPTTTTDAVSTNDASELYCFWPQKWVKAACCSGVLGPQVKFGSWAGESFQLCIYLLFAGEEPRFEWKHQVRNTCIRTAFISFFCNILTDWTCLPPSTFGHHNTGHTNNWYTQQSWVQLMEDGGAVTSADKHFMQFNVLVIWLLCTDTTFLPASFPGITCLRVF
jgi:hypothetical protein